MTDDVRAGEMYLRSADNAHLDSGRPAVTIEAELLDSALLCVIQHGCDRCGLGWGTYPWGVLDAMKMLMRFTTSPKVEAALADLEERLAR